MLPQTTTPIALCQCGCGQPAPIAPRNNPKKGHVKGQPMRFIRGHNGRAPLAPRFWAKVDRSGGPDACWPFRGYIESNGYGRLSVNDRQEWAHRVAYELTYGPLPPKHKACHSCDNPPCCNPAHLFPGTQKANVDDMVAKGRARNKTHRGGEHGCAKLTDADVLAIRAAADSGETGAAIAQRFGVSASQAQRIIRRKAWSHLP